MNLKKDKDGFIIGEEPAVVDDLRRIREQMYEEEKHLTFEERRAKHKREVEEFLCQYGYKIIDLPNGMSRLVKVNQPQTVKVAADS